METGERRQEKGDGRQEMGDGRTETGERSGLMKGFYELARLR